MSSQQTTVDVSCRPGEGYVILDIEAPNFTYPQTAILKTAIIQLLDKGQRYFVINCNGIQLVDSYGLATIVSSLKLIKDHHGALVLFGLNELFLKLVDLTQLDKVLEVWDAEAQATYYLSTLIKA